MSDPVRVLVVDEDKHTILAFNEENSLNPKQQFLATQITDLEAAYQVLTTEAYDVVVVNGILRQQSAGPVVKKLSELVKSVIVTTETIDDQFVKEVLSNGAVECLEKPIFSGTNFNLVQSVAHCAEIGRLKLQLQQERMQFKRLVRTDDLTKLDNRKFFVERLEIEMDRQKRYNFSALSLVMIDLDDFKHINDSYRHVTGDRVIRDIARKIKHVLRLTDFAGRYGGEEFCIGLPNTPLVGADGVTVRLLQEICAQMFLVDDTTFRVTASMGICVFKPQYTSSVFLDHADEAMYDAKKLGGNRVCVYGQRIRKST